MSDITFQRIARLLIVGVSYFIAQSGSILAITIWTVTIFLMVNKLFQTDWPVNAFFGRLTQIVESDLLEPIIAAFDFQFGLWQLVAIPIINGVALIAPLSLTSSWYLSMLLFGATTLFGYGTWYLRVKRPIDNDLEQRRKNQSRLK